MRIKHHLLAVAVFALSGFATGSAWAGPTDGNRQTVSPPSWSQQKEPTTATPYSLTGERRVPTRRGGPWTCELQNLGNKVQTRVCRRQGP
jgi:hypothetical protein